MTESLRRFGPGNDRSSFVIAVNVLSPGQTGLVPDIIVQSAKGL
ncbi:MAG: hypothetical protein ACK4RZ_03290 [Paracoccaceae bacterium]